jgi:hypothetical protein
MVGDEHRLPTAGPVLSDAVDLLENTQIEGHKSVAHVEKEKGRRSTYKLE